MQANSMVKQSNVSMQKPSLLVEILTLIGLCIVCTMIFVFVIPVMYIKEKINETVERKLPTGRTI